MGCLEVVPGVGAVEAFVAEREVGDDVSLDHRFKQRPLEPGRIAQMAALNFSVRNPDPDENVAAERLGQRDAFAIADGRLN